jgi:diacylglycerol kinase
VAAVSNLPNKQRQSQPIQPQPDGAMKFQSPPPQMLLDEREPASPLELRLSWAARTGKALRGIKLGARAHSSFFVQFFFALVAVVAGLVLRCDRIEWCILAGCIASVLSADLFYSAVETILSGLDRSARARVGAALDTASGAVLLVRLAAAIIGSILLLSRLYALLHRHADP